MHRYAKEVIPGLERRPEQDETWKDQARCRIPELRQPARFFYPERGESLASVKNFCAQCPVQVECREYALAHRERCGIWGGTSERERRRIVHARKGERRSDGKGAPSTKPAGPRHHSEHSIEGGVRV